MPGYKPNHVFLAMVSFLIDDGVSGLRLNDDTDLNNWWSVPDVCLRLGRLWLNQGLSLALTVCVVIAIFIVSSQFVN